MTDRTSFNGSSTTQQTSNSRAEDGGLPEPSGLALLDQALQQRTASKSRQRDVLRKRIALEVSDRSSMVSILLCASPDVYIGTILVVGGWWLGG